MSDAPPPDFGQLPAGLLDRALERFLGAAPSARAAICRELLESHPAHAAALERMFADLAATEQLLDSSFREGDPDMPDAIGGYRVIRRIGEGAFGIVHLCEQESPVRRQVAVKLLRPGAGDRNTLRRFEAERQLLASLNHGSITQIFDAGHLPDGRPYFVMEFVDGLPITTFAEQHDLDCAARLRLFVDVCLGVEHAHARGIVHRDLKPANVLIVDARPAPLPKLIDFGIAKALDAPRGDAAGGPGSTDPGRVIGTPGYMSPEQAGGRADQVDARSDVFALGVMLYELLTDELPWERGEAATDRDPELPSARITTRGRRPPTRATSTTGSTPRRLAALLRGDLDWITLKALAREPERRYSTVRELIDDIERHRTGMPVLAGPPSASYRFAKFIRRNRSAMASLGIASVASAIVLWASVRFAARADVARGQAQTEADANSVDARTAVDSLLARASDERMRRLPRSDGVRQLLLQDALAFYDRWLGERPTDPALLEQRCQALLLLSRVHWQLGQLPEAERVAAEAGAIAAALHAASPDDIAKRALLADALRKRGTAQASAGRIAEAVAEFENAVRDLEICFRADAARYGMPYSSALREVGSMLQTLRRPEESLAAFAASFRVLDDMLPGASEDATLHSDVVFAAVGLAQQSMFVDHLDDAETLLVQADGRLGRVTVDRLRATASVQALLGRLAQRRRDPGTAIVHVTAALEAARQWRLEEPERLMPGELEYQCARHLGEVHEQLGAWDDATEAYRGAIEIADAMAARFREDPMRVVVLAQTLRDLSGSLWNRFRFADLDQASAWARRAVALRDQMSASVDPTRRGEDWEFDLMVARIDDSRGQADAAAWEQIASELERREPTGGQHRVEAWVGIARSRLTRGLVDESEAALAEPRLGLATGHGISALWIVEIARIEAGIASARGSLADAADAADRILAARPTWLGRLRAAEVLCGTWRRAAELPDAPPDAGVAFRDRAALLLHEVRAELDEDVSRDPDDPWFVVPWGFANVLAAEIEASRGDREAARRSLARAMPTLRRIEPHAHRDQWDAGVWATAKQLELALDAGAPR